MQNRRGVVLARSGLRTWAALSLPLAVLGALLLGTALAALPASASAVTPVVTEPGDRENLSQQPGAVTLAFDHDIDSSVAKVIVIGPNGKNVTSGPLVVEGTNVTSRLRTDLGRGTYTVHFRIDGKGGEPEGGAYQFSYGSGSFTDLPDRSWSGAEAEPAVLRGTNPNTSEEPDAPSSPERTPGIQVTSQGASSDPNPPPTDEPATVQPPRGRASDAGSAPATSVPATPASATPEAGAGSSGTPWIVGGVLLLAALVGTGLGVQRSRARGSSQHE